MADANPTIIVNNVTCKLRGVPRPVTNLLSQNMAVKVPNYWFSPKYKRGFWDGTYKFFVRPGNTFPTGLLDKVLTMLKELGIEPDIIDERVNVAEYKIDPISEDYQISEDKTARDYQVDTVNKLSSKEVAGLTFNRGVINIATNGGKTSIATMYINELYPLLKANGSVFLFVTHSKEIARQAKQSIESDLGIELGFIGDGQWDVKPVTVAIVTTLYRRIKKPEFAELVENTVGFVADECHHSSSDSWYTVFNAMQNASVRIGLTGTVDKSNPVNEMKLYSCTGEIVNRISNDYLIQEGVSAKPVCILFRIESPELDKETYTDAYQMGIVESEERLDVIYNICDKETSNGNTVLILVEHIEHGEIIEEALEPLNKNVRFTHGSLGTETRQEILDNLRDGKIDVLISTAILDEGVDVSNINSIIYARGMKSSRKLLQGIGRGLRKKEDNTKLRFYDFMDDMNTTLLKHSLDRYRVLKAEQFDIKRLDLESYNAKTLEEICDEE